MSTTDADDPEIVAKPLATLDEVWKWGPASGGFLQTSSISLKARSNAQQVPKQPRTLVCHDMKGGYLDDRFAQGVSQLSGYRFFHWSHVDIFVYFSHSFITIPPPSWIDCAHLHGVSVLGTVITEANEGTGICKNLFSGKDPYLLRNFIQKLVDIARHFRFEGWLINIENEIEPEQVQNVRNFLYWLTLKMRSDVPGSFIIWYDSVTKDGELKWQNELNATNKMFFDACDGIYLNYNWDEEKLSSSLKLAGDRSVDVYVGIDVFGRGTYGGGGFNSDVAFKAIRRVGLSVALFAPGWVHEVLGQEKFTENEYRYWSRLTEFSPMYGPSNHPFSTTFCQGFGSRIYRRGKILETTNWNNQSLQQYQPTTHGFYNKESSLHKMRVNTDVAYSGGGCLEISGLIDRLPIPVFRLFTTNLEFKVTLLCTVTFHALLPSNCDLNLLLKLVDGSGRTAEWVLSSSAKPPPLRRQAEGPTSPRMVKVFPPASKQVVSDLEHQGMHAPLEPEKGWITRFYVLAPERNDVNIRTISVQLDFPRDHRESSYKMLLGQIQIIPLHLLLEHHVLSVQCSSVAISRTSTSNSMGVTCVITWSGGTQSLLDCYDLFCRLQWVDGSGRNAQPKVETHYVASTRRTAYKMNAFSVTYPGTGTFKLRFIVQEHLIGLATLDLDHSDYAEVSFS